MELRKSTEKDINSIMKIIAKAQDHFKNEGIDQWQNNYPNSDTIKMDIDNNHSYVLTNNDEIVGTTAIIFEKESTYEKIYDGRWLSDNDYVTIHRIAVDDSHQGAGIGTKILKEVENLCTLNQIKSIRVDTHEDNKAMQKLLEKNGYKYCGIILLNDGNKRIAFEKIISI